MSSGRGLCGHHWNFQVPLNVCPHQPRGPLIQCLQRLGKRCGKKCHLCTISTADLSLRGGDSGSPLFSTIAGRTIRSKSLHPRVSGFFNMSLMVYLSSRRAQGPAPGETGDQHDHHRYRTLQMSRFDANESDFLTYEDQAMRWLIPELPPTPRAGGGASGGKTGRSDSQQISNLDN